MKVSSDTTLAKVMKSEQWLRSFKEPARSRMEVGWGHLGPHRMAFPNIMLCVRQTLRKILCDISLLAQYPQETLGPHPSVGEQCLSGHEASHSVLDSSDPRIPITTCPLNTNIKVLRRTHHATWRPWTKPRQAITVRDKHHGRHTSVTSFFNNYPVRVCVQH